jgi:LAO/AO transport system kinase
VHSVSEASAQSPRNAANNPAVPHVALANAGALPTPPSLRRPSPRTLSLDDLADGVRRGDRAVLGRALSLIESSEFSRQRIGQQLLSKLMTRSGGAMRIGITGVPGAGKSTFIDRLGVSLVEQGHRVAVLAVDPSSSVSGGSILGDRTRMQKLSADARAFIRPSPSGGTLGGVANKTRESILVCEAAGFDVVLVETVGVGQSETSVAQMTDVFVALAIPGAGDDLQGIKRGILELVDVLVVNKADGESEVRAKLAACEYESVLQLARGGATEVSVLACSSIYGFGVSEVWAAIARRHAALKSSSMLEQRRQAQSLTWLHALVDERLRTLLHETPSAAAAWREAEDRVRRGEMLPTQAADTVMRALIAVVAPDRMG